ncbi:sugar transferase [Leptobacterium flavescens]|uniref:Sugar transferase n=1 Tax=Leptobacterium flavescens TaxID=472055 RepID=A0A6P0UU83_9FLAO|nr:sugar transferase [Leptobacterium flavescens]NER13986.1 sugar transferase [Leptobacterium flavescens]
MYKNFIKRLIDFLGALIGFLILFPITFTVGVVLAIVIKGNPFFFQSRPGKNERIFKIIKFKTMTDARDDKGELLPDIDRVTPFGEFLRKTSLDEIPQLLNVIIGDMSIVGPRPLRVQYLPYYNEEEQLRHTVRPGITGLAQVSGRNLLGWDEKLAKDVEYVKKLSFILDCRIILKTVEKVFKGSDVVIDPNMLDFDKHRQQQIETNSK